MMLSDIGWARNFGPANLRKAIMLQRLKKTLLIPTIIGSLVVPPLPAGANDQACSTVEQCNLVIEQAATSPRVVIIKVFFTTT